MDMKKYIAGILSRRRGGSDSAPAASRPGPARGGVIEGRSGEVGMGAPFEVGATGLGKQYSAEEVASLERRIQEWGNQSDLSQYVKRMFEAARRHREPLDADAVTGYLMESGRQWSTFDSKSREVMSLISTDNDSEKYVTDNLIGMLVQKVGAIVTSGRVDVSAVPLLAADLHRAAAREGNAIMAAEDIRLSRREQVFEWVRWSGTVGSGWILPRWDRHAQVEVADVQEGKVVGRKSAPIGAMSEEVVPGLEIFVDPSARTVADAGFVIHATTRSKEWVISTIGKEKFAELDLKPDSRSSGVLSPLYLSYGEGALFSAAQSDSSDCFGVLDFWAKPGGLFPDGARIVLIGGVVVHAGAWPYKKRDSYPFLPLRWRRVLGTPYGKSLAAELASLQFAYNRALTDVLNFMENAVPTLLNPEGSELKPGEYAIKQTKSMRLISFNAAGGAMAPTWQNPPTAPGDLYRIKEWVWDDMQHLAGVHDPSMGLNDGGSSGIAINLLQESDRTQHAPFLAELEAGMRDLREWEIALYTEFAAPFIPRMIGLDETGNPLEDGKYGAMALSALTGGGSVAIHLVSGSAISQTPEAKKSAAMGLFTGGLLGVPGSPESRARWAELANDGDTDKLRQWALEDAQKADMVAALEAKVAALEAAQGGISSREGLDEIGPELGNVGAGGGEGIDDEFDLGGYDEGLEDEEGFGLNDGLGVNDGGMGGA